MDLTTSSAPAMIFPVLKNSNILECLDELGIEFSKTELLEPAKHREKLRQVFTQLVSFLIVLILFQRYDV